MEVLFNKKELKILKNVIYGKYFLNTLSRIQPGKHLGKEKEMFIDIVSRLKFTNELNKDELLLLIRATDTLSTLCFAYKNVTASIEFSNINNKLNRVYDENR